MCPRNHWTWCFRVFHVSFSLTSKRKAGERRGGGRRQKLRFTWRKPSFSFQPLNYKQIMTLGSIAALKPPRPCSSHHMEWTRQQWEACVCAHCSEQHGWLLARESQPDLLSPGSLLQSPSKETAHYGWQNAALEAPLQFSWLLCDQAVINWADNLGNKNAINSNRPRWGKLYTVERGEKHTCRNNNPPSLSLNLEKLRSGEGLLREVGGVIIFKRRLGLKLLYIQVGICTLPCVGIKNDGEQRDHEGRRVILTVKYLNITGNTNILFDQQTLSSHFHL